MAWVYILKSVKDGHFYVGSTTDIDRRLRQHRRGHTQTTRIMGDVDLVFSQQFSSLEEARKLERKIKKLKRKDYIAKIVADGFIKMQII
jgi:putative endonuclease